MTSLRWTIFVGAVIALSADIAEAKCGFRRYRIEVEFRSGVTRDLVSGVQLAVFANGSDAETATNPYHPYQTTSRDDGRLIRTFWFNTYSGSGLFATDRCNNKVRTLELVALHPNYRAKRISLKKLQITPKAADDLETIVIPLVLMDSRTP